MNKKKSPVGHNSLTCIFANAIQQSSSIATATGTQIWPYHKTAKGHLSLIILTNLVDLESPIMYTKYSFKAFLVLEKKIFKCFTIYGHGSHLVQRCRTIWIKRQHPFDRRPHVKSDENWSSGFREEYIYRFQGFIPVYSTMTRADNSRGQNFDPN